MLDLHARAIAFAFAFLLLVSLAAGETGSEAWLRYPALSEAAKNRYRDIPRQMAIVGDSPVSPILTAARQELIRGLSGMLGRRFQAASQTRGSTIILGTTAALETINAVSRPRQKLGDDGFWL